MSTRRNRFVPTLTLAGILLAGVVAPRDAIADPRPAKSKATKASKPSKGAKPAPERSAEEAKADAGQPAASMEPCVLPGQEGTCARLRSQGAFIAIAAAQGTPSTSRLVAWACSSYLQNYLALVEISKGRVLSTKESNDPNLFPGGIRVRIEPDLDNFAALCQSIGDAKRELPLVEGSAVVTTDIGPILLDGALAAFRSATHAPAVEVKP